MVSTTVGVVAADKGAYELHDPAAVVAVTETEGDHRVGRSCYPDVGITRSKRATVSTWKVCGNASTSVRAVNA